jgi:aryl-alcohol dehydrogenase-like predicted oxidoreductase
MSKHPENGRLVRSAFGKAWLQERHLKIAEALLRVTNGTGKTPAQVALAWLRQRPERAIPIIGAMNVAQLRENLGCLDVYLDAEKITELNRASLMPLGYPHDYLREPLTRALLFGKTAGALDDLH